MSCVVGTWAPRVAVGSGGSLNSDTPLVQTEHKQTCCVGTGGESGWSSGSTCCCVPAYTASLCDAAYLLLAPSANTAYYVCMCYACAMHVLCMCYACAMHVLSTPVCALCRVRSCVRSALGSSGHDLHDLPHPRGGLGHSIGGRSIFRACVCRGDPAEAHRDPGGVVGWGLWQNVTACDGKNAALGASHRVAKKIAPIACAPRNSAQVAPAHT